MKIAAAAFGLFLTAGLVFSAITIQNLQKEVRALESKVASMPEPRPASESAPVPASPSRSDDEDDSAADAASGTIFEAGDETPVARKSAAAGTDNAPAPLTPGAWTEAERAAFEKEVLSVLEKREQEQKDKRDEKQMEWVMAKMTEKLNLNAQQAEAIAQVLATTSAQVKELRQTMTPETKADVRTQIQTTVQGADTQIKSCLTAEQIASYDELKKSSGGLMGLAGGPNAGGQGGGGRPQMKQSTTGGQ